MRGLRQITVGVRSQSALVIALTLAWYLSFFGWFREMDSKRWYWTAACFLLPFVISLFTAILLVSYWRAGRVHGWWMSVAVLAAVSSWVLIFCVLSSGGFLR
jgi:hypothetical protein